jgi:hypothetical protein
MGRICLIAVLAASLTVGVAQAGGSFTIRGDYQMGPFSWTGQLADAETAFGKPTSMTPGLGLCKVRWAGIAITFGGGCSPGARFIRFVGDGRGWRTGRGLAVGAPISMIHKLYPSAKAQRVGPHVRWSLFIRPPSANPSVAAWTKGGRVIAIIVTRATIFHLGR